MQPTTNFEFGDVVLVPFPFTDQTTSKKRPAVVVSSQTLHRENADLVLMAVTSTTRPWSTLEVEITGWEAAGLLHPCVVKPVVFSIERRMVLKRLGRLHQHDQRALRNAISAILG